MTLEGTIQEIFHQILKLNPNYRPEDFPDAPDSHTREVGSKLEKRIPVSSTGSVYFERI